MPWNFEYVPNVRIKLIGPNHQEYDLPGAIPDWWGALDEAEVTRILTTGRLNRSQCKRFWEYLGRTDRPPSFLRIALNREDLARVAPEVDWTTPLPREKP
jgi:hypothetical protein